MTSPLIKSLKTKDSYTKNGAITNSTSLSSVLDLFFLAGACRNESEQNIESKLMASFIENKELTLKCIFWAGDIRGGAGERRFFKLALNWLNNNYPEYLISNLENVPEYSRWDVIFDIKNEDIVKFIASELKKGNTLLAKWLPRKKQKGNISSKIRSILKITPKQYRKILVNNSNTVENKMCKKEFGNIEYKTVPSVAMKRYTKAFYKNDKERFDKYIEDVKCGKEKINAGAIFPHEIIKDAINSRVNLNEANVAQWNSLPNYLKGTKNSILPVCDVSGSMYGLPMEISVALGLYISERNEGIFKDAFMTFESNPKMEYLKGDINQRLYQLKNASWGGSTNIQATFDLILKRAKEENISKEYMPEVMLIISDMEFNECSRGKTNFEDIKLKYSESGYNMPSLVFWNVNGRVENIPVKINDEGVALISGVSPSIIKSVLHGDISPEKIMLKTLNNERYNNIKF